MFYYSSILIWYHYDYGWLNGKHKIQLGWNGDISAVIYVFGKDPVLDKRVGSYH